MFLRDWDSRKRQTSIGLCTTARQSLITVKNNQELGILAKPARAMLHQAGCDGCSVWNAHAWGLCLGGSGAQVGVTALLLLCKHSLCRSSPAYLSLWVRVSLLWHSCSGWRSVPPSCSLRVTQVRPLGNCRLDVVDMHFLCFYTYTEVVLLVALNEAVWRYVWGQGKQNVLEDATIHSLNLHRTVMWKYKGECWLEMSQ